MTQEARQVDRNIASSATVIAFKEMGMLQSEFDRPELRKLVGQAREAIGSLRGDRRRWSYVYSPDADQKGLLENELATFWKPALSTVFASAGQVAVHRTAKRLTRQEKTQQAMALRSEGHSLREIANMLGVSKSTVRQLPEGIPLPPLASTSLTVSSGRQREGRRAGVPRAIRRGVPNLLAAFQPRTCRAL